MANLSNINGKFVVEQTTGYVGVGTTDPNYPIEVLNASAEIALNASGGSTYRIQSDSASNFIIRKEGVGDRLVINSAGTLIASQGATFGGDITIYEAAGNAGIILSGGAANNETYQIAQGVTGISNGGFSIRNMAETKDVMVFQDVTGNVGIGTITPGRALDVGTTALIEGAGNVTAGTLALGPRASGVGKWSTISGAHYNQSSGSGNGSGSGGIMIIGTYASNGENDIYVGGGPYEMNAATRIGFYTHTTNTSTAGGTERMRITSAGIVQVGGKVQIGDALVNVTNSILSARKNGTCIEYGHLNTNGRYEGTVGVFGSSGFSYIGFSTSCDTNANTFTTRGWKGNVVHNDSSGNLIFAQATNASAIGQTLTERMRIDTNGVIQLTSGINGYLNTNSIGMEMDINRNPETGAFKDAGLSHARIIMRGDTTANGGSNIKFVTSPTVNTVGATRMTITGGGDIQIPTNSASLQLRSSGSGSYTSIRRDAANQLIVANTAGNQVFGIGNGGELSITNGASYSGTETYSNAWNAGYQTLILGSQLSPNSVYIITIDVGGGFATPPYYASAVFTIVTTPSTNGTGGGNDNIAPTATHVSSNAYWKYRLSVISPGRNGVEAWLVNGPTNPPVNPTINVKATKIMTL